MQDLVDSCTDSQPAARPSADALQTRLQELRGLSDTFGFDRQPSSDLGPLDRWVLCSASSCLPAGAASPVRHL